MLNALTMSLKPATQKKLEDIASNIANNEDVSQTYKKVVDHCHDSKIPSGYAVVVRDDDVFVVSSSKSFNDEMSDTALMQYSFVGVSLLYLALMGAGKRISIFVK
eukprot:gnl/Chilomastix_caulleri/2644.p1 GENE.gnl/Chilomastix_caulleri/2644~~gnl/Chilomastix_caulleri/2644.p1  ORF type:complete len:105 (+),score=35.28 gnl/Chilomastix_caulleri/2644:98-412(+)